MRRWAASRSSRGVAIGLATQCLVGPAGFPFAGCTFLQGGFDDLGVDPLMT